MEELPGRRDVDLTDRPRKRIVNMQQEDVVRAANGYVCGAIVVVALSVSAVSCAPPPGPLAIPGRDGGPRQTGGTRTGRAPRDVRMDAKPVAGKEPPTTLVAEDGTKCVVTESRYRDTKVGDEAWCVWRLP